MFQNERTYINVFSLRFNCRLCSRGANGGKMKFVFFEKNLFESGKIIEVLESKCVPYQLKPYYGHFNDEKIICAYDIEIDVTLEYFDFLKALVHSKMYPYVFAEICYRKTIKAPKNGLKERIKEWMK